MSQPFSFYGRQPSRSDRRLKSVWAFVAVVCVYMWTGSIDATAQVSYNGIDGRRNYINTAVPFLRISPDARSGAMGDVGIALSPDANAVYWNLAKLPFAAQKTAVSVTYTPWLREMANDLFLADLSAYHQLDNEQAIGVSLRYFDMGQIQLTDIDGASLGNTHPREFAIDAGYARKLSDNWSMGVAFRYINSNLVSGIKLESGNEYRSGSAFAGDISASYIKNVSYGDNRSGTWSFGATLTNLGTKIAYTKDKTDKFFIPSNLGVGGAYTHHLNNYKHQLTLALDINKLLVPTPDTADGDRNGIPDYREKSSISGIFNSFGDAPDGMSEELRELMYSVGIEYWYDNMLAIRAGYFNEHETKGDRKYVTLGVGLRYNMLGVDFSYLVPSGSSVQKNPLSNTLRLTLSVNLSNVIHASKTGSGK